ncbi:MAG: hypothetical protein EZS28_002749 [Streblomastix strix]|uniref:Uncharacterized protein n=1 Tax=Streblomastix strix TaxID=222440 RepID=A0A5J4X388_9EUKA|nr:MAG: hypothetical protein EZS28_002749 [Streblomastix strix]
MAIKDSTIVETISNESINIKCITSEKGPKRQYNHKSKIDNKAKELMDKLIKQQELERIKREQDKFDVQKKEADEQEFTKHIMEDVDQKKSKKSEKKQVTGKLIDLALIKDDDLCVIDFDINKKLSIEETDKIRQNIMDNMLPANEGLVMTAYGGLHVYCNRGGYTLPSNRCVKCIVLDNIEIDIFGQIFKYKEHGGMEQKELVQNRVVGPNLSSRETKYNKRETLKYEAINDWGNMTHLASLREILDSWNVDIEIPFKEYIYKVNMREFGWQIIEEGTIEQMNDEIAQACVNELNNPEIHNYPQLINLEVFLLSAKIKIYDQLRSIRLWQDGKKRITAIDALEQYHSLFGDSLCSPFTQHNRVVDSVIRTIRNGFGQDLLGFATPTQMQLMVEIYNKTPHLAFMNRFTPKQVQYNRELEDKII